MSGQCHGRAGRLLLTGGEDVVLDDGWAVCVMHVPGHSKGHLAIWDQRSSALVISDAVLGDGVLLANGRPAFPPTYRWVQDYRRTIEVCAALSPSRLLTAHYPGMDGAAATDFFSLSRDFADLADQVIVDFVISRPTASTVREVVLGIDGRLGPWPAHQVAAALAQPVIGHLEDLTARGILEVRTGDGVRRWGAPG